MNRVPVFIKWLTATLLSLALLTATFFLRGQQIEQEAAFTPFANSEIKTVLLQLAEDDKSISGLALLVKEPGTGLQVLNIPPQVATQFGQAGLMTIQQAGTQVSPREIADALSISMGVRIDATLALQRLAIAGLVDSVGGVDVTAATGLLVSGPDQEPLYVAPGQQKLTGQYAAGYALVKQLIENEDEQINRMNIVIRAMLNNLPMEQSTIAETLASLGSLARSDVSVDDLATFFVAINQQNLWPAANYVKVDTDSSGLELMPDTTWLRIKQPKLWDELAKISPRVLVYPGSTAIRVEVKSQFAGDRVLIADQIAQLGLGFIDGGSSETPEITQITTSVTADIEKVEALRNNLGLSEVPIVWDFTLDSYADVRIVVGLDYRDREIEGLN